MIILAGVTVVHAHYTISPRFAPLARAEGSHGSYTNWHCKPLLGQS
ncbi:MAG: hypothetical protein AB1435_11665 [Chloroflexota bacterium]